MNTFQVIFISLLCAIFSIVSVVLVIRSILIERYDDMMRKRNSRYIFKGVSKDETPIYLELPKK